MEGTPKNLMIRALLKGGARLGQETSSGAAPFGQERSSGAGAGEAPSSKEAALGNAAQSLAFEQSARELLAALGVDVMINHVGDCFD